MLNNAFRSVKNVYHDYTNGKFDDVVMELIIFKAFSLIDKLFYAIVRIDTPFFLLSLKKIC